jgi:hypothetical protein
MRRIYVAIPYTRVEERSFEMANHAAYEIIKQGNIPLSPISMSHPIVQASIHDGKYEKELLGTWEVWSKIDYSFIDWSQEIWIVNMSDNHVEESVGVQAEIEYGKRNGKIIRYIGVRYGFDNTYEFIWPEIEDSKLCEHKVDGSCSLPNVYCDYPNCEE